MQQPCHCCCDFDWWWRRPGGGFTPTIPVQKRPRSWLPRPPNWRPPTPRPPPIQINVVIERSQDEQGNDKHDDFSPRGPTTEELFGPHDKLEPFYFSPTSFEASKSKPLEPFSPRGPTDAELAAEAAFESEDDEPFSPTAFKASKSKPLEPFSPRGQTSSSNIHIGTDQNADKDSDKQLGGNQGSGASGRGRQGHKRQRSVETPPPSSKAAMARLGWQW